MELFQQIVIFVAGMVFGALFMALRHSVKVENQKLLPSMPVPLDPADWWKNGQRPPWEQE